jgi:hypothetical protein
MRSLTVLLVSGACVLGPRVYAHHSFAATYLEDQSVTIEGELVQFLFRNPHSFMHINVKEKDGSMVEYSVEWGGTGQLGGQGITRETLKPGDHVVITGSPGRNAADHRVRMLALRRPRDGWSWGQKAGEVTD